MTIQTKKIIAREFLFLVTTLIVSVVAFLSIYIYNLTCQNKINGANTHISITKKSSDSLSQSYNKKLSAQFEFSNKYINKFNLPQWNTNDKIWKKLCDLSSKDSIQFKWKTWDKELINFIQENGFKTSNDFKVFIDKNTITSNDIEGNNKSSILKSEIISLNQQRGVYQSKLFSSKEQFHFSEITFLVLLSMLFAIRYIFYGIKWSIKVLSQKDV